MDINQVLELIRKGESLTIEFKEKPSGLGEEISALANAEGGFILIGVDDKGNIIGCDPEKALNALNSTIQNLFPTPEVKFHKIRINQKWVCILEVKKSDKLIAYSNIAYIRIGTSKKPLSIQEIYWLGAELGQYEWDKKVTNIEFEFNRIVDWYKKKIEEKREKRIDIVKYLKSIEAIKEKDGKLFLTNGGILFFYENPQEIFPNSGLRIIKVNEAGEPIFHQEFFGPIWKIANDAISWLEKNLKIREIVVGAERKRFYEYPIRALREAIINALIHRNYTLGADVRIFIYPDKLIVRSPGGLLPGVNLEDPEHVPRNRVLCQLMYDIGYIEKYGYGIRMMRNVVKDHPLISLEFKTGLYIFDVVFKKEEKLDILDDLDRKIISLLREKPAPASEIAKNIGISKQAVLRRIKKMISIGLIRRIGRGPKTRYSIS